MGKSQKSVKRILLGGPVVALVIVLAVLFSRRVQVPKQQKTAHEAKLETRELVNNLNRFLLPGSTVAISHRSEGMSHNMGLYTTVSFFKLERFGESEILPMLKKQGITHLLITSSDVYTLLFLYGDLVTRVKTDKGYIAFRYGLQTPLSETTIVTRPNNRLSGIYIVISETSNQLTKVVCELLSQNETKRLLPQEIFFNGQRILNNWKTLPYTVLIDCPSENPFEWSIVCVPPELRNSIGIKLFLLDEPSEHFAAVTSLQILPDTLVKVWKVKYK